MTTTADALYQLDPEGAHFDSFLAELFELDPLTDTELEDLQAAVEAARRHVAPRHR